MGIRSAVRSTSPQRGGLLAKFKGGGAALPATPPFKSVALAGAGGLRCNSLPRLADEFFVDSADPRIVRRDMRPDFWLPGCALLSAEKRRCRPCSELADRRHGADFVWSTLVGGRHRRRRGYRRDDGDALRSSPGRFKSRDRLHVSARMGIRDLSNPCRRPSPCCFGARLQ